MRSAHPTLYFFSGRGTVKTWLGLLLTFLAFMAGCAPGYSAKTSAYPEESTYQDTGMGYQNPETDAERTDRIWSEGAGR